MNTPQQQDLQQHQPHHHKDHILLQAVLANAPLFQSPEPEARCQVVANFIPNLSITSRLSNEQDLLACLTYLFIILSEDSSDIVKSEALTTISALVQSYPTRPTPNFSQSFYKLLTKIKDIQRLPQDTPNPKLRQKIYFLYTILAQHHFLDPTQSFLLITANKILESNPQVLTTIYNALTNLLTTHTKHIDPQTILSTLQTTPPPSPTPPHDNIASIIDGLEHHQQALRLATLQTLQAILHNLLQTPSPTLTKPHITLLKIIDTHTLTMLLDISKSVRSLSLQLCTYITLNSPSNYQPQLLTSDTSRALITNFHNTPKLILPVFKLRNIKTISAFVYVVKFLEKKIYDARIIFDKCREKDLVELLNWILKVNDVFTETVDVVRRRDDKLLPIQWHRP